ncbi:MAG: hypothetical protein SNJ54_06750 [Anaerolineae bacterium]
MSVLQDAYELIQQGQLDDAKALLNAHRQEFTNNADYWWLVAHSTTDPEEGRAALGRVLLLDKDYPGARELDDEVRAAEQLAAPATTEKKRRSRLPLLALVALLVVALGIGAVLILNNRGDDQSTPVALATDDMTTPSAAEVMNADATSTTAEVGTLEASSVATDEAQPTPTVEMPTDLPTTATEAPTDEPTATVTPTQFPPTSTPTPMPPTSTPVPPTATSEPVTATPDTPPASATLLAQNQEPVFVAYEFMQGQLTPPNGVFIVGDMLSISLCAVPGIGAGNAVRDLLMTVSIGTAELDPSTRTIEIGIVDCTNNNEEQRVISVPRESVEAYARGEITLQQLQQTIRPVR